MKPYEIPHETNYADAIRGLVRQAFPGAAFEMKPTAYTTPHLIYGLQQDPWGDAEDLALSIGMRLKHRGNRVRVYVPLRQTIRNARWRYATAPLRTVKRRIMDRIHPPVEWPDPDYSD